MRKGSIPITYILDLFGLKTAEVLKALRAAYPRRSRRLNG